MTGQDHTSPLTPDDLERPRGAAVKPGQCGNDGSPLHPDDLAELRRFGAYLRASHGADEATKRRLYLEHYPEHAPDQEPDQ